MNRFFGSKKEPQPIPLSKPAEPENKAPPVDLNAHTAKLEVRIQEINGNIANIDKDLREQYPKLKAAKGSQQNYYKQRVLTLMKKRKMYQQQVDNLLGQQFSVEQVAFTKENIQNTIETTKALKEAAQAQREAMKNLDIDDIADLREEMDEMVWESNQINDMLNRDYAVDVDEGDLDAELKELEDEAFMDMLDNKAVDKPQQKQEQSNDYYSMSQMLNKNTY